MTTPLDCVLIHVPKFSNYYKPLDDYIYVKYIPLGVLGIADLLQKKGYRCEIVHLGVEWIENRHWDLVGHLKERSVRVVGLPLYWHYQSYDAIEVARSIKRALPDVFVVLGGFTASTFSEEIMENYRFVDGIIVGDGETPMVSLLREVTGEGDFASVPNLVWRRQSSVIRNKRTFTACREDMDAVSYSNFSLLRNHAAYRDILGRGQSSFLKKLTKKYNPMKTSSAMTPIAVGRGCTKLCAWCAGNAQSQLDMSGRRGVSYRSHFAVIDDILRAKQYGFGTIYLEPLQGPGFEHYFIELFSRISEKGISINVWYEQSGLPSPEFIDAFAKAFPGRGSTICLSRESFSEESRNLNKDDAYSNSRLFATLNHLNRREVRTELALMIATPTEKAAHLPELIAFRRKLLRTFPCIRAIPVRSKELEPGSLWFHFPEKYGMETERRCFSHYYEHHSNGKTNSHSNLGYRLPGYFDDERRGKDIKTFEAEIQKIRCKHFCMLGANTGSFIDPWVGRLKCNMLYAYWKLKTIRAGRQEKSLATNQAFFNGIRSRAEEPHPR